MQITLMKFGEKTGILWSFINSFLNGKGSVDPTYSPTKAAEYCLAKAELITSAN